MWGWKSELSIGWEASVLVLQSGKIGGFIQRICILRRIVFSAYLTVLNKPGRIIRLHILPFWGDFWPF